MYGMRWFRGIFLGAMMCVGMCAASARAVTAELATGDAPRGERWETLVVHVAIPPGGARLSVRDARGGLMVSRNVDGGEGDVLMPLPFVAESELPDGVWPVEIGVGDDFEKVSVTRPGRTRNDRFRVALVGDASVEAAQGLSGLPLATVKISATDLVSGPPLAFAGFDAVVIPEAVAVRVEEQRILTLAATGVKIIVAGERPANFERLAWQAVGTGKAWIFPASSLPALPVIEPALASSRVLQVEATANGTVRAVVALVPVAALILIVLMRGMIRGRWSVLLGCVAGFAVLTGGTLFLLRENAPGEERRAGWSIRTPMPMDSGKRVLTERETLRCDAVLFDHSLHASVEEGSLLLPIAPDAGTYFGWREAILTLNADGGAMVVDAPIRARRAAAYLERSASLTYPEEGTGWPVDGGYVETPQGRQLLTAFAARGEERGGQTIRNSLLAWYDLRFDVSRRYVLRPSTTQTAEIIIDDLGVADRNTP